MTINSKLRSWQTDSDRAYKEEWIQVAATHFINSSQQDCLVKRSKCKEQHVNCFIRYSPLANNIDGIIQKYWHIVESDPKLQSIFDKLPRVVYKRPPNLRNMLVRADLLVLQPTHSLSNIPFSNFKCGCCQQCNCTYKTQTFNHPSSVCTKGLRVTQFQLSVCMCCTCGRIDNKADLT